MDHHGLVIPVLFPVGDSTLVIVVYILQKSKPAKARDTVFFLSRISLLHHGGNRAKAPRASITRECELCMSTQLRAVLAMRAHAKALDEVLA